MRAQNAIITPGRALPRGGNAGGLIRIGGRALGLIADRVAPASLFALFLAANGSRTYNLVAHLEAASDSSLWQLYGEIAHRSLVSLFLFTIVLLYMFRRPALRKGTILRWRIIALAATFITTANGFAPTTLTDPMSSLLANLLIITGMIVAVAGLMALRRCFGILPEARGLVTTGLYGHVRHPVYLGETIAALGMTLPVISPVTGAIFIAYLLLQGRRAVNEEKLLEETFSQYRDYSRRTKRFVPFLW